MSGVTIKKVTVLNNPARFTDPFTFEVTYQALQDLDDDLEWKVSYLSSPNDASLDQELENVMVGPITSGVYKFILEADPPDGQKEFIRVGFFIHVDYEEEEMRDNPPEEPLYEKLMRNVALDDPRVTTKPLDPASLGTTSSEAQKDTDAEMQESEEPAIKGVEKSETAGAVVQDRL